MSILQLHEVGKTFQTGPETLSVLEDITLTIPRGMVTVITGESGSGKSTLLNLIGGLDTPSTGSIDSCGYAVSSLNEEALTQYRSRELGLVFQFHFLLKDFTALENVYLPGWMAGKRRRQVMNQAEDLLRDVGMDHRLHHYPSQLSGGERQRTALARALINGPQLLLADEPTGNLDPENSRIVEDILFSLVQKYHKTLILVTHDQHLADRGDVHYHLEQGKLVVR